MLPLKNSVFVDDCLKILPMLSSESIPLILTDLPYGKTQNEWDSIVPLKPLFAEYERILAPKGNLILFGQDDFSAELITIGKSMYRYSLVWNKVLASGHLNANVRPLRSHEDVLVFYKRFGTYNPQKTHGKRSHSVGKASGKIPKRNENYGKFATVDTKEDAKFPRSILTFEHIHASLRDHPTQKPVSLLEYLIRTYSNEGDVVLDNCAGAMSTAVACLNSHRKYICVEIEKKYAVMGLKRIKEAKKEARRTRITDYF